MQKWLMLTDISVFVEHKGSLLCSSCICALFLSHRSYDFREVPCQSEALGPQLYHPQAGGGGQAGSLEFTFRAVGEPRAVCEHVLLFSGAQNSSDNCYHVGRTLGQISVWLRWPWSRRQIKAIGGWW